MIIFTFTSLCLLSAFWVKYIIDYLGNLNYELRFYINTIISLGKIYLIESAGPNFLLKKFPLICVTDSSHRLQSSPDIGKHSGPQNPTQPCFYPAGCLLQ